MTAWAYTLWALAGGVMASLSVQVIRRLSQRQALPQRFEERVWAWLLALAALIYTAFSAVGGAAATWQLIELGGLLLYGALAMSTPRFGRGLLGFAWLTHIAWDALVHHEPPGHVPAWYVPGCLGFDVAIGLYLLASWQALSRREATPAERSVLDARHGAG